MSNQFQIDDTGKLTLSEFKNTNSDNTGKPAPEWKNAYVLYASNSKQYHKIKKEGFKQNHGNLQFGFGFEDVQNNLSHILIVKLKHDIRILNVSEELIANRIDKTIKDKFDGMFESKTNTLTIFNHEKIKYIGVHYKGICKTIIHDEFEKYNHAINKVWLKHMDNIYNTLDKERGGKIQLSDNMYYIVSKNISGNTNDRPWRVTTFIQHNNSFVPSGHCECKQLYSTERSGGYYSNSAVEEIARETINCLAEYQKATNRFWRNNNETTKLNQANIQR